MPHEENLTPTDNPGENPDPNQGQSQVSPPPSAPPPASDSQSREPNPIGVPSTVYDPEAQEWVPFTATITRSVPGTQDVLTSRGPVGEQGQPPSTLVDDVAPQYFDGDETRLFATRPRQDIIGIQRGLVAAGMLDADDLSPGVWDEATSSAMSDLLGYANATGADWESALNERIRAHSDAAELTGGESEALPVEPYAPPSWKELAQTARESIESVLGRDLEGWEVELAATELGKFHREQFETDVLEAKASRNAQLQAAEAGEEDEVVPETVEGIQDHGTAFRAWFHERFGDELERKEDVEESQAQQARVARVTSVIKNLL